MKTAKTNKNLIKILSAIISVVFACIVGITYCVTSLDNLKYGANPNGTTNGWRTPLQEACVQEEENINLINFLLEKKLGLLP